MVLRRAGLLKNKKTLQSKRPAYPTSCFVISQVGDIGSSGQHLHRVSAGRDPQMKFKVQPRTKQMKNKKFWCGWGGRKKVRITPRRPQETAYCSVRNCSQNVLLVDAWDTRHIVHPVPLHSRCRAFPLTWALPSQASDLRQLTVRWHVRQDRSRQHSKHRSPFALSHATMCRT